MQELNHNTKGDSETLRGLRVYAKRGDELRIVFVAEVEV